jgi:hypothetical protein
MYMCRQCLLYMCVGVPHMQAVYVSAVPHMQRRRREKQEVLQVLQVLQVYAST